MDNFLINGEEELALNEGDIHSVFVKFNRIHFQGLLDATIVEWSDRMTLCAGICYLKSQSGIRYCIIRLSRPILQYRPYNDILSTLLHEMIHAFLWIKTGYLDRDGHGEAFLSLAAQINRLEMSQSVNITVYHTFHAEVEANRKHVWRCDGPCKYREPYFGLVKRSMNRKPQPADWWWKEHERDCGGKFIKIKEPSLVPSHSKDEIKTKENVAKQPAITSYFKGKTPNFARDTNIDNNFQCPVCINHSAMTFEELNDHLDVCLIEISQRRDKEKEPEPVQKCPICDNYSSESLEELDAHVQICIELPAILFESNPSSCLKEKVRNHIIIDLT